MKALEGIRVLDLTRLLPGPFGTMFMADFGAEVIKIEQPGEGDYARWYQPQKAGMGYRHIIVNRNKKSLTLDLKKEEGKKIFYKLAQEADVIIESFRPGVTKRLGVDYETIKVLNKRIVYCSLTGFGQKGKYKMDAGHDLNYISLAGVTSLTGQRGGTPYIPGIQIADLNGGIMAVMGILIALHSRNNTGYGQYVDASLFSAALTMLPSDAAILFGSGQVTQRGESRLTGGLANYSIYKTKDERYLAVGALEKKFWANLCKVIQRQDLVDVIDDKQECEKLFTILEKIFAEKTLAQWEELLQDQDTCVTPVRNLDEVFADAHVKENELVVELEDEKLGAYRQLGIPIKLSDTPGTLVTRAPDLGEHTDDLLEKAGFSKAQIDAFRNNGII